MKLSDLKTLASGASWLAITPWQMLKGASKDYPVRQASSWDEEKQDILERAEWLSSKVIVEPKALIAAQSSALGPNYGGQWAIYACSYFNLALANISRLYPEEKGRCLERMEKVIDIIHAPELRHYDAMQWKEDPIDSLDGDKSHMTYLSILAWAISNYKLAGGNSARFDDLFYNLCHTLARRMSLSPDLNLPSFPNRVVFIPDMMVAIMAMHNHDLIYGDNKYSDIINRWLQNIKTNWIHRGTGLIVSKRNPRHPTSNPVLGCYTALNCYSLTQLDDSAFSLDQYGKMKRRLIKEEKIMGKDVVGVKEYLRKSPAFKFDYDAGPIIHGFSPSGTAWAIGAATYYEDWDLRSKILRTADLFGHTIKDKGSRHYRIGELSYVGEAVALAMRTNKNWHP